MSIYNDNELKQLKNKNDLKNIKSDYFLIKTFDIMKKYKKLKIIENNKKLIKRLNLSIDDYKKYSQLYSSVEIELKIGNDKYSKFINISDENKEYYHIYFDNSNEKIKNNYLEENKKVNNIKI